MAGIASGENITFLACNLATSQARIELCADIAKFLATYSALFYWTATVAIFHFTARADATDAIYFTTLAKAKVFRALAVVACEVLHSVIFPLLRNPRLVRCPSAKAVACRAADFTVVHYSIELLKETN